MFVVHAGSVGLLTTPTHSTVTLVPLSISLATVSGPAGSERKSSVRCLVASTSSSIIAIWSETVSTAVGSASGRPRPRRSVSSTYQRVASAAMQAIAGTAPVSYQSGRLNKIRVRWACDKFLRHTIHLWADCFRKASAWGQTYYQQKRDDGMSHASALRCLGQRLLKIIFRMISDKQPYDAELHARNQQKHGSWVLKLINQAPA